MSSLFPGSGVLTQDSAGHTSMTGPSNCTEQYLRNYSASAALSSANATCKPNTIPFAAK